MGIYQLKSDLTRRSGRGSDTARLFEQLAMAPRFIDFFFTLRADDLFTHKETV
jgi:hypothetical protein